jgi:Spy/CpxP family protein refolding chaperone
MRKNFYITVGVIALVTASGLVYSAYAYQGDPAQKGPNFSPERHEQMQKAFESNDFNAWKELMNERGRVTSVINEQNFAKFAEMHRLMLEGKYDDANKIREDLGLGQGRANRDGGGKKGNGWQGRNGNCNCQNADNA